MIPDKWGQGQLFAYSALNGESYFTDDFTGTLAGDRTGVIFNTICRRTLYFGDMNKFMNPELKYVTSDMIVLETLTGTFSMLFAERHLIVGEYNEMPGVFVSLGGGCEVTVKGDAEIHNTFDGEYTALMKKNGRFAFAYGKSEEAVTELCKKGIETDLEALRAEKKKPFESGPKLVGAGRLLCRCAGGIYFL